MTLRQTVQLKQQTFVTQSGVQKPYSRCGQGWFPGPLSLVCGLHVSLSVLSASSVCADCARIPLLITAPVVCVGAPADDAFHSVTSKDPVTKKPYSQVLGASSRTPTCKFWGT